MKYKGSKARFASRITPFTFNDFYYVEPFAGGMNLVSARPKGPEKVVANDKTST